MNPPLHWADCPHAEEDLRLIREHPVFNFKTYRCRLCHGIVVTRDPAVTMIAGAPDASFDPAVVADMLDRLHPFSKPND